MARSFNLSSSEYLEIDSSPVSLDAPLTMAAWVYPTVAGYDYVMWTGDKDDEDQGIGIQTVVQSGAQRCRGVIMPNYAMPLSTAGHALNTWAHYCVIAYASNSFAAFLNGGNKGTNSTAAAWSDPDRVSIARAGDSSPGAHMSGAVAEAAIWNIDLTDAEAAMLGVGFSPLFVRPQSLVAYWPLIRDEDQDRVGGYDLTAYNTPSIAAHPPIIYPSPPHIAYVSAGVPSPPPFPPVPGQIHRLRRFPQIRM